MNDSPYTEFPVVLYLDVPTRETTGGTNIFMRKKKCTSQIKYILYIQQAKTKGDLVGQIMTT